MGFSRIISSPLKRTRETSEIIAETIDFDLTKIKYDQRLAEYDMGEISGTSHHQITAEELISSEGAEDTKKFQDRVIEALNDYKDMSGNILVVSSAGVGRIIESHKQDLDTNSFYDLKPYPNGHIIKLDRF